MQRSNSTSPHHSERQHPPPTPNQHHDHQQTQNQDQVNSFPSSDNHSQQHNQQYDQEGGEGQVVREGEENIEQYSDAPPPSSQLVKYGTNLPQSTTGLIIDRVISLPPHNSFPPQQRNQYQGQQQQGKDQRYEIPAYRPSSNQQQQRHQGLTTSPRPDPPSLPVQTPVKNLFARPPAGPSPQVNSSPLHTPSRPSDPVSRLITDPIATNRIKQNTTSEGTTYALPPPNGGKVLVKRASKGVNGGFKVPWMASPGQEKENEKKVDQGGSKDVGEEKGKIPGPTPTRAPSVEEQQVLQMLSAQKVAAQKRAQAVQVSLCSPVVKL